MLTNLQITPYNSQGINQRLEIKPDLTQDLIPKPRGRPDQLLRVTLIIPTAYASLLSSDPAKILHNSTSLSSEQRVTLRKSLRELRTRSVG